MSESWLDGAVLFSIQRHMTSSREVQKKESEDVVNLDGPKSKKSKLEEDTITVKEASLPP